MKCCGDDRSLVVTHSEKGYSWNCFRGSCDNQGFRPHGTRTIQEMLAINEAADRYEKTSEVTLPDDFTYNIPDEGLIWLLKAGVNWVLRQTYGIGWSPSMARVVMPVQRGGWLVGVQSRAVLPDQKPKYLNKTGADNVLYWSDHSTLYNDRPVPYVVCTEDILSCIKVGQVATACATLGTSLTASYAAELLENHNKFIIWYDNDEAGHKGAIKAKRELELQGAEDVVILKADDDPKAYNFEQIKELINEALSDRN